jgi:hypothetical protein
VESVVASSKLAGLPQVSPREHENLQNWISDDLPTNDDARAFFSENWFDFITTDARFIQHPFESIIYSRTIPFVQVRCPPLSPSPRILLRRGHKGIFHRISEWKNGFTGDSSNDGILFLNSELLVYIIRGALGLCCILLLMAPVAILLLADLTNPESFGVMISFGTMFMFVLGTLGIKLEGMLIGFCAYLAVLTACLVNLR